MYHEKHFHQIELYLIKYDPNKPLGVRLSKFEPVLAACGVKLPSAGKWGDLHTDRAVCVWMGVDKDTG